VRILELLDRLGLADAAVARGVKTTTVEIYEQGRRAASFRWLKGAEAVTPYPFALGLPQDETESVAVGRVPANARPSVASRSPMSEPASSTSAAASGITCCCSRDQHPTRRHVVESLLSQFAVDHHPRRASREKSAARVLWRTGSSRGSQVGLAPHGTPFGAVGLVSSARRRAILLPASFRILPF
jgi:hypothetical protein